MRTLARLALIGLWMLVLAAPACAGKDKDVVIAMHRLTAEGAGETIGTVTASDTPYGLLLTPRLHGLQPGPHGFHLHANAACGPKEKGAGPGTAAGGHFDPKGTGKHEGPYGNGHLGDLPVLIVDKDGNADVPVLAPRLKVADLAGHALIIHAGGDNYSDKPKSLGGGGGRVACGIIE